MARLATLAREMADLEQVVIDAEKTLRQAQAALAQIQEKTIPEQMDALGIEEFTATGGLKISIGEVIRASIPKARQEEAVLWLDDHGFGDLVKRKFVVSFQKNEEKWANKFARDLAQRKRELAVTQDKGVHAQTLSAFVREQLAAGNELPMELFNVYRQRLARLH